MTGSWRTIRVFISSTFRDMHSERDHLVRVVFPELRERCAKRRLHLVDVDLRWGVTEEEAEQGRALEVGLDEIERCRPFFIGLLGERYGSVLPRGAAAADPAYDWLRSLEGDYSITAHPVALERLEYGGPGTPVRYRSDKSEGPTAGTETVDPSIL